jgi:hypothetical protein
MTKHIKICGDPHCEAIYHNTPKFETRCKSCDGRLIIINEETFYKKYKQSYFQYDFVTEEYFRLNDWTKTDLEHTLGEQLKLF